MRFTDSPFERIDDPKAGPQPRRACLPRPSARTPLPPLSLWAKCALRGDMLQKSEKGA